MKFHREEFLREQCKNIRIFQFVNKIQTRYDAVRQWIESGFADSFLRLWVKENISINVEFELEKIDWCSYSPDSLLGVSIKEYCYYHDTFYGYCITYKDRKLADKYLRNGIRQKLLQNNKGVFSSFVFSQIYYRAVRQWGYIFYYWKKNKGGCNCHD